MVPAPDDGSNPSSNAQSDAKSDGGVTVEFDEIALYEVIRRAVEDAILGVIGTLLLVGVAFVVVWAGIALAAGAGDPVGIAFGVAAVTVGLYIAAATLWVIPPIREWF